MTAPSAPVPARTLAMVERNFMMYRRSVTPLLSSMVEPVLYLVSIGIGVGMLVGQVPGVHVRYAAWVAPAILATTASRAPLRRPETTTVQPSAASATAPASPMPLPPPVTQATRFPPFVMQTVSVAF